MVWTIKFTEIAEKQLRKLDKSVSRKILTYLKERIASQEDPHLFGKALLHDKTGFWCYRVEDYRIICTVEDQDLTVLVLRVGHRRDIYEW